MNSWSYDVMGYIKKTHRMFINYILLKYEEGYIKLFAVTKIFKMILTKVIILASPKILPLRKSKGLSRKRESFKFTFYHLINTFHFPLHLIIIETKKSL